MHCLKFNSKQEAEQLIPAELEVDTIGIIYKLVQAGLDDIPPVYNIVPGWHVNRYGEIPDFLKPYEIFPSTPTRMPL